MGFLGKIIGGSAGFFLGGPMGAVVGAALGHAADSGSLPKFRLPFSGPGIVDPARVAATLGRRDQVFAISVVVLAAKLAKCDGPVVREEIDTFKRLFRIPDTAVRDIGRLFDHARDNAEDYESFADRLGETFADNRGTLEEVLVALFAIARADKPITRAELDFLRRVHRGLGLDQTAWERAWNDAPARNLSEGPDPYDLLGLSTDASAEQARARWLSLVRDNHPDRLAARGVPPEFAAKATEHVARINAAWDRIKRERGW